MGDAFKAVRAIVVDGLVPGDGEGVVDWDHEFGKCAVDLALEGRRACW